MSQSWNQGVRRTRSFLEGLGERPLTQFLKAGHIPCILESFLYLKVSKSALKSLHSITLMTSVAFLFYFKWLFWLHRPCTYNQVCVCSVIFSHIQFRSMCPRNRSCISCTAGRCFTHWATWKVPYNQDILPILKSDDLASFILSTTSLPWGSHIFTGSRD